MNPLWGGVLCGALVGVGVLLIWRGLPMRRQATLADRMAPYLGSAPRASRLLAGATDEISVNAVLAPVLRRAGALVDHWLGGTTSVRRRLGRVSHTCPVRLAALWGSDDAGEQAAVPVRDVY